MARDDHERRIQVLDGIFDRARVILRADMARDAHHEDVAHTDVEKFLDPNARIGTGWSGSDRVLPAHRCLVPPGRTQVRMRRLTLAETQIPATRRSSGSTAPASA